MNTARRDGDQYVIIGLKTFTASGWHAILVCLTVMADIKASVVMGMPVILVEAKDLPIFCVGRYLEKVGMNSQGTCKSFIDDVCIPAHLRHLSFAQAVRARRWPCLDR
jgi:acyl-CoA dehydrogenase